MSRIFNGQVHVRIPPSVHKEVAEEAFEKGTSISGIFAQALIARRALKSIDPWRSIAEVQSANGDLESEDVESIVTKAVKAVRRSRRG